ncbi:MAG: GNAT family N-acetyltransferase [Nocardioides sp.]
MDIRPLDLRDGAQFRRYHEIAWNAENDGRPWTSMWTHAEMHAAFHEQADDERFEGLCAYDGEAMVGAAFLAFTLADNLDKAYLQVWVEPGQRRRGIGSALVEAAVARVVAEGRTTITGEASYTFAERDTAPTLRWATANGFQVANVEVARDLALPVPTELLEELLTEAARHHEDYTVETYDELPEGYVPSSCALVNQMVLEAPMGELDFEEEQMTPEVFAYKRARDRSSGRRHCFAVAVHDGEVVGLTDLMLPPESTRAHQWQTLVHRDHRGHRLGQALKAANLLALQRRHPGLTEVHTQNAEVNEQMIANDRLGFVPVAVVPDFKRTL